MDDNDSNIEYAVLLQHNTDPKVVAKAQHYTTTLAEKVAGTWFESELGVTNSRQLAEEQFRMECDRMSQHEGLSGPVVAVRLVSRKVPEWRIEAGSFISTAKDR